MASVLTITPNPSSVGDTVAVATVADTLLKFTNGSWGSWINVLPDITDTQMVTDVSGISSTQLIGASLDVNSEIRVICTHDSGGNSAIIPVMTSNYRNYVLINSTTVVEYELQVRYGNGTPQVVPFDTTALPEIGDILDIVITFNTNLVVVDAYITRANGDVIVNDITSANFPNVNRDSCSVVVWSNLAEMVVSQFRYNSDIYGSVPYTLEQDAVEITSGTTTGGAISYDHTAQLSDNNTDWKYIVDGVDSNTVAMLVESGASEYIEFTADSDTQFQVQAVSFKPDITINYKLVQLSKGTYTSIDRGATTDRYSTTLVISGSLSYIESLIRELTLLRSAKKSVLISSPYVNIFGDNVDYSSDISTVIGFFGKQKTVQFGKQEITVEFIATDLSFVGVDTLPNALQCLQNTWSGYAKWNTKVNETYNRSNYFVDRETDEYHFTGRYIMTIEENKQMINFWKNTRGEEFSIDDDTFGATNMFGATRTGFGLVIIKDYKYSILSPTHRAVTIELIKVG